MRCSEIILHCIKHGISRQGVHKYLTVYRLFLAFGKGYSWTPDQITITRGDFVKWKWWYPTWVNGFKLRIEETANSSSFQYKPDGFRSASVGSKKGKKRYPVLYNM